jgi:hypothetical protein
MDLIGQAQQAAQNHSSIIDKTLGAMAAGGGGFITYQAATQTLSLVSLVSGLVLTWLGIWVMVRKLKTPPKGD